MNGCSCNIRSEFSLTDGFFSSREVKRNIQLYAGKSSVSAGQNR